MTRLTSYFAAGVLALCAAGASASELDYRVDTATQILKDLQTIPENAVPPALLSRAYAVAVIPSVIKGGLVVGGTYGKGIIVARRAEGTWSNPAFVQLTQGSVGFQAGLQSTDLILVFKNLPARPLEPVPYARHGGSRHRHRGGLGSRRQCAVLHVGSLRRAADLSPRPGCGREGRAV